MTVTKTYSDGTKPSVGILGAGVSGIIAGYYLKKYLEIEDLTIFEGEEDVGGTWQMNTYPGCACDVNSHLYSFYENLNPNWSKNYVGYAEIQKYLKGCVNKFDIEENLKLNTWVTKARFNNNKNSWNLTYIDKKSGNESTVDVDILIGGVGALRIPNIPKELTTFEGKWLHSAKWDHSIELKDKVVGIVGSGASAVQIVPNIIDKVSELHTFQRTPPYVIPRGIKEFSTLQKFLFNYMPWFNQLYYWIMFLIGEIFLSAMYTGSPIAKIFNWLTARYISIAIKDPVKRELMMPKYHFGCKRITPSDTYYQAIDNPKTYIHDGNIEKIEGKTLYLKDGSQQTVDILILATGYKVSSPYKELDITNSNGDHIDVNLDKIGKSPQLNYGITSSGVPNFFMMLGPSTGLGHNTVMYMIECQANYITDTLSKMMKHNIASVDLKAEVADKYWSWVQKRVRPMVWHGNCKSWYQNSNGQVIAVWPGTCTEYYLKTVKSKLSEYNCTPKSGY